MYRALEYSRRVARETDNSLAEALAQEREFIREALRTLNPWGGPAVGPAREYEGRPGYLPRPVQHGERRSPCRVELSARFPRELRVSCQVQLARLGGRRAGELSSEATCSSAPNAPTPRPPGSGALVQPGTWETGVKGRQSQ